MASSAVPAPPNPPPSFPHLTILSGPCNGQLDTNRRCGCVGFRLAAGSQPQCGCVGSRDPVPHHAPSAPGSASPPAAPSETDPHALCICGHLRLEHFDTVDFHPRALSPQPPSLPQFLQPLSHNVASLDTSRWSYDIQNSILPISAPIPGSPHATHHALHGLGSHMPLTLEQADVIANQTRTASTQRHFTPSTEQLHERDHKRKAPSKNKKANDPPSSQPSHRPVAIDLVIRPYAAHTKYNKVYKYAGDLFLRSMRAAELVIPLSLPHNTDLLALDRHLLLQPGWQGLSFPRPPPQAAQALAHASLPELLWVPLCTNRSQMYPVSLDATSTSAGSSTLTVGFLRTSAISSSGLKPKDVRDDAPIPVHIAPRHGDLQRLIGGRPVTVGFSFLTAFAQDAHDPAVHSLLNEDLANIQAARDRSGSASAPPTLPPQSSLGVGRPPPAPPSASHQAMATLPDVHANDGWSNAAHANDGWGNASHANDGWGNNANDGWATVVPPARANVLHGHSSDGHMPAQGQARTLVRRRETTLDDEDDEDPLENDDVLRSMPRPRLSPSLPRPPSPPAVARRVPTMSALIADLRQRLPRDHNAIRTRNRLPRLRLPNMAGEAGVDEAANRLEQYLREELKGRILTRCCPDKGSTHRFTAWAGTMLSTYRYHDQASTSYQLSFITIGDSVGMGVMRDVFHFLLDRLICQGIFVPVSDQGYHSLRVTNVLATEAHDLTDSVRSDCVLAGRVTAAYFLLFQSLPGSISPLLFNCLIQGDAAPDETLLALFEPTVAKYVSDWRAVTPEGTLAPPGPALSKHHPQRAVATVVYHQIDLPGLLPSLKARRPDSQHRKIGDAIARQLALNVKTHTSVMPAEMKVMSEAFNFTLGDFSWSQLMFGSPPLFQGGQIEFIKQACAKERVESPQQVIDRIRWGGEESPLSDELQARVVQFLLGTGVPSGVLDQPPDVVKASQHPLYRVRRLLAHTTGMDYLPPRTHVCGTVEIHILKEEKGVHMVDGVNFHSCTPEVDIPLLVDAEGRLDYSAIGGLEPLLFTALQSSVYVYNKP